MSRALACGLLTLDIAQAVEEFPRPNEKIQSTESWVAFGGPAANAAATSAALGIRTGLVSAAGDGLIGRIVADGVTRAGVGLIDLAPPGFEPPVSAVVIDRRGDRNVVSRNAAGVPDLAAPVDALADCSALLVDGHYMATALQLARRARAMRVPVLLDSGSWKPGMADLLQSVDVAVLSADFQHPDGRPPSDWGPATVAITHGDQPLEVFEGGSRSLIPTPSVDVVDTLGAGDVLHGALLAVLASQRSGDLPKIAPALTFAAELASHSCRYPGAQGWWQDETAEWRDLLIQAAGVGR